MLVTKLELGSGTPEKRAKLYAITERNGMECRIRLMPKSRPIAGQVFAADCNLCSKTYELGTVSQRLIVQHSKTARGSQEGCSMNAHRGLLQNSGRGLDVRSRLLD
jgi:hypothetical protein